MTEFCHYRTGGGAAKITVQRTLRKASDQYRSAVAVIRGFRMQCFSEPREREAVRPKRGRSKVPAIIPSGGRL